MDWEMTYFNKSTVVLTIYCLALRYSMGYVLHVTQDHIGKMFGIWSRLGKEKITSHLLLLSVFFLEIKKWKQNKTKRTYTHNISEIYSIYEIKFDCKTKLRRIKEYSKKNRCDDQGIYNSQIIGGCKFNLIPEWDSSRNLFNPIFMEILDALKWR